MLSVQEALGLDMLAPSCGARVDQDIITSGLFTPWGPESCPSLEQVMMMASTPEDNSREAADEDDEEERRRQRRKISNRLSAQRSRARKQQRLEELRAEAARLRAEKDALAARLRDLARHDLAVRCHNARLRAEAAALARRLREARRVLVLQRLAQFVQQPPTPVPAEHRLQVAGGAAAAAPVVGLASSLMT